MIDCHPHHISEKYAEEALASKSALSPQWSRRNAPAVRPVYPLPNEDLPVLAGVLPRL